MAAYGSESSRSDDALQTADFDPNGTLPITLAVETRMHNLSPRDPKAGCFTWLAIRLQVAMSRRSMRRLQPLPND
jgi:hypothetical protein